MSDVRTNDLERRRPQPDSDGERSFKRQKIDGEHWQLSETKELPLSLWQTPCGSQPCQCASQAQSLLHNTPASPSHHCTLAQSDSSSPPAPLSGAEDTPAALEPQMRDDPGIEAEVLDPSVTAHDTVSPSSQPRSECATVAYALSVYFSSYASGHPRITNSAGHGDDGVITSATLPVSDPAAPGWTLLPVRVARKIQACTQQTGTRALETLLGFSNYGLTTDWDPETIDIQPRVIPASTCHQALPVPDSSPLVPEHSTLRSESPSPRARLELLQDLPSECETSGRAPGSTGNSSISDSPTSEGPFSRPEEATVTECYDWESLKRAVERTQSMIDQLLRTAELEEAEVIRRVALPHLPVKGEYI